MKVLFLDIDGVVNCENTFQRHRGWIGIDPHMAFLVGKIQLDTDCKVVLSSSWRHGEESKAEVRRQVVDFIDVTPSLPRPMGTGVEYAERGKEILAWIKTHNDIRKVLDEKKYEHELVTKYAILDDDSDFLPEQPLFKTSWKHGITEKIAKAVTEYLNSDTPMCFGCYQLMSPVKDSVTKKVTGHQWKCKQCAPKMILSIG